MGRGLNLTVYHACLLKCLIFSLVAHLLFLYIWHLLVQGLSGLVLFLENNHLTMLFGYAWRLKCLTPHRCSVSLSFCQLKPHPCIWYLIPESFLDDHLISLWYLCFHFFCSEKQLSPFIYFIFINITLYLQISFMVIKDGVSVGFSSPLSKL